MYNVTMSGLDRMEYHEMGKAINQTKSALDAESVSLMSTTQDWGWWDDMYQYATDQDPEFLDRNTKPEALAIIRLNLFMILDRDKNLLYGNYLSPDFTENEPVPSDLAALVQGNPRLTTHPEGDPGISGILVTPGGPMVVASVPILRSDKSGPAQGTLVMGRYLEYGPLPRIADITGYRVNLVWQRDAGNRIILPDFPGRVPEKNGGILVKNNESTITGYSMVSDLSGRNLFIGVSTDRQLYRIGLANIFTYLVSLAIWAVITGIIVVIIMDRMVLLRIDMLTDRVRSLSGSNKAAGEPVLAGSDELAELERTITSSRIDLQMREGQLRTFVNAMPGPAALFSRDGRILLFNPSFAEHLDILPDHIEGARIQSCVFPGIFERHNPYVKEVIRKKEVVHFEDEIGGKTLFMSYYPVLDSNGGVAQLGFLAFDISERKRLENALQKVTRKMALLHTVVFSDIQNKVFVQMGYLELARQKATDSRVMTYLEKEETLVREIQSALSFARQYNDMGVNPPRWQNTGDVILFAISHLDPGSLVRDFDLAGIEIYADPQLERVFVTLVENTIQYATNATFIRAGYTINGDKAVIFVEDNGPGIEDDKKELIFSKGIGAGGSTSLFLSREILSITGISIKETGTFGKGARFEIYIPKGSYRLAKK